MVCPKALVAIQGISRNVFGHAVSEIEMVEIILDHEIAFEVSRQALADSTKTDYCCLATARSTMH